MKKLRGFLIDPEARTITEVFHNGDYKQIYEFLKCDCFTIVSVDDRNMIFVDDEGLLKDPRYFFLIRGYPQPLAGRGLLLGCDQEGETVSTSMDFDEVTDLVVGFRELSVEGFKHTEEENVNLPFGGKGFRITQTPIFGPPKEKE